jgi:hypothetical protein
MLEDLVVVEGHVAHEPSACPLFGRGATSDVAGDAALGTLAAVGSELPSRFHESVSAETFSGKF